MWFKLLYFWNIIKGKIRWQERDIKLGYIDEMIWFYKLKKINYKYLYFYLFYGEIHKYVLSYYTILHESKHIFNNCQHSNQSK